MIGHFGVGSLLRTTLTAPFFWNNSNWDQTVPLLYTLYILFTLQGTLGDRGTPAPHPRTPDGHLMMVRLSKKWLDHSVPHSGIPGREDRGSRVDVRPAHNWAGLLSRSTPQTLSCGQFAITSTGFLSSPSCLWRTPRLPLFERTNTKSHAYVWLSTRNC